MKKRILITTPFPTPEEVAAELGVSRKRLAELRTLVYKKRSTAGKAVTKRTIASIKPGRKKAAALPRGSDLST